MLVWETMRRRCRCLSTLFTGSQSAMAYASLGTTYHNLGEGTGCPEYPTCL